MQGYEFSVRHVTSCSDRWMYAQDRAALKLGTTATLAKASAFHYTSAILTLPLTLTLKFEALQRLAGGLIHTHNLGGIARQHILAELRTRRLETFE